MYWYILNNMDSLRDPMRKTLTSIRYTETLLYIINIDIAYILNNMDGLRNPMRKTLTRIRHTKTLIYILNIDILHIY